MLDPGKVAPTALLEQLSSKERGILAGEAYARGDLHVVGWTTLAMGIAKGRVLGSPPDPLGWADFWQHQPT